MLALLQASLGQYDEALADAQKVGIARPSSQPTWWFNCRLKATTLALLIVSNLLPSPAVGR